MTFATRILWCIVVGSAVLFAGCVAAMVYFQPPISVLLSPGAKDPYENWFRICVVAGDLASLCVPTLLATLIVMWVREREEKRSRRGFPVEIR